VVAGPTLPLDIKGNSSSLSMTLTQPFVATENWLVQGTLSAFTGESDSFSAGVPVVASQTEKYGPGITVAYTGERGSFSTQAQAVFARVDDRIAPAVTNYKLATGSYNAGYRFENGLTFIGRGAWQYSDTVNLPGNLLFSIGGPNSVRGYPSDGVSGNKGYYTNWELHRAFENAPRPATGFVFADFGEVFSSFPAVTSMASVGFGGTYDFSDTTRLELTAAFPVRNAVANQSSATLSAVLTVSRF
jgi:hemolysin activation/secretion protein